MHMTGKKLQ